jgi:hypothetical protein
MGQDGRIRDLERRVAALEKILIAMAGGADGDGGDRSGEGEPAIAESDGVRFMVPPGKDPAARGRALRRAIDKADGKLVPDDAG